MRARFCKQVTVAAAGLMAAFALMPGHAADRALAYTVSKNGELRGYLLGTVHSDDPRVLGFSPGFTEALESCERFAMELVPNQPTLSRLMDFMHYQDGTTLVSRIGQERFERVVEAAQSYHLDRDRISTMKVWAAMMTLSIPPPKNGLFMDLSLALQAAGMGLEVVGLESLEEQLSFLQDMPEQHQLILLDQALEEFEQLHAFYDQLISAYVATDLQKLETMSESQFEDLPDDVKQYFFSRGIDARNERMLARLLEELEKGRVFAAVGALHLPGETGLIRLLRREGFTVEPAPFPLFAE